MRENATGSVIISASLFTARLDCHRFNVLVVVSIADGEAADAAGILLGDLLIAVDGRALASPSDLLDALSSVPEGGSIRATVLRGGIPHEVTIEPRDRDREGAAA